MMTPTIKNTIALFLASLSFGWTDETKEPPQTFTLEIGDKIVQITDGEPFELDKLEAKTKAVLKKDPLRKFKARGVEFKYPTTMSFECDVTDPASQSWTLSGTDATVMFFSLNAPSTPQELAASMIPQFGKKNCSTKEGSVKLLGEECEVCILSAKVAGQSLRMEIIGLKSDKGTAKLLVLQDALSDDGKNSAEYKKVRALVIESFAQTP